MSKVMQLIAGRAELELMWFLIEHDSLQPTLPPETEEGLGEIRGGRGLPHWLQEAQFALSPGSHSFYPIPQALTKNRQ